jgi:hypothetical protein
MERGTFYNISTTLPSCRPAKIFINPTHSTNTTRFILTYTGKKVKDKPNPVIK